MDKIFYYTDTCIIRENLASVNGYGPDIVVSLTNKQFLFKKILLLCMQRVSNGASTTATLTQQPVATTQPTMINDDDDKEWKSVVTVQIVPIVRIARGGVQQRGTTATM